MTLYRRKATRAMTKTDRVQIEFELKFTTLFHCGTGIREGLVDRTVVRDSEGYLYIPGSTFKGVLRERCEQLARLYELVGQAAQLVHSPHDKEAALQGLGNNKPTMVTRIFGSQNVPGQLFFDDARQSDKDIQQYDSQEKDENGENSGLGKYKSLQVDLYTQVRLDRPTRTAVPGALFTSEFGTNDVEFKGMIQGWIECTAIDFKLPADKTQHSNQTPTYSLLLLLAGLRVVDRLGGNKSSGKGQCQCEITTVKLNGEVCAKNTWFSWLEQLDTLANYNKIEEG